VLTNGRVTTSKPNLCELLHILLFPSDITNEFSQKEKVVDDGIFSVTFS